MLSFHNQFVLPIIWLFSVNPDINPRISALRNLANITDTTLFIEENEFELEILTKEIFVKTKYLINVKIPLNITLG
jgi:hypothetical protein